MTASPQNTCLNFYFTRYDARMFTLNPTDMKVKCPAHIRIGTRASQLAVAQAMEVKNRLLGAFPQELTQDQIELVKIQTTGDRIQTRPLAEIGGKGLFTKEIEEALQSGAVDIAVHSMKDMPDTLPEGMIINCILEREDPRDAFISRDGRTLAELPQGAVVGTSSARRQAQLLRIRPDVKIVPFRGNVNTRLKKLELGEVDATLLAVAGLKRIDLAGRITQAIPVEMMLPAVAQGAIGVECLSRNAHLLDVLEAINHPLSRVQITAERAFLQALGGSCATPIAAFAEIADERLTLRGLVASLDGQHVYEVMREGNVADAAAMGVDAGVEVLRNAAGLLG
jgi:hydroxymethylbilane synthase